MLTIPQITQYGYAYVVPSICVFGIICNILNLTVLLNSRLKESPYTYLTGLATFDMLTLIFGLSITFTRSQTLWFSHAYDLKREYILSKLEKKFFLPTANVFSPMSVIITVALTIERFFFIKFPMKASTYCLPKYARRIIFSLFTLVCLFRIPYYLFYDTTVVKPQNQTSSNQTIILQFNYLKLNDIKTHCDESNIYNYNFVNSSSCRIKIEIHYEIFQKYYFLASFIILEIIPFFIMAILNSNLILIVRKSNVESKKLQKTDLLQQQKQLHNDNGYDNNDRRISASSTTITQSQILQQQQLLLPDSLSNLRRNSLLNSPPSNGQQRRSISLAPMTRHLSTITKRDRDQFKLTRTLIAVIFIALISEISSIVTYDKITYFLIGRYHKNYMKTGYQIQRLVSLSIVFMSHSVNFFLYCAFNRRYLNVLRETYSFILNKLDFRRQSRMNNRKILLDKRNSNFDSNIYTGNNVNNSTKGLKS